MTSASDKKEWLKPLGGFLIIVSAIALLGWFLSWLWRAISALPPNLQTPVIAVIGTALVSGGLLDSFQAV